jgi:hypothetical protein
LFSRAALEQQVTDDRVLHLTPPNAAPHESVTMWQEHFLPFMLMHLANNSFSLKDLTFVYGDTHTGGWGEVSREPATPLRLYNTGGWVSDGVKDHPACHLFAVDEAGEEYLLDVTFAGLRVGEANLLEAAYEAAEHQHWAASTANLPLP